MLATTSAGQEGLDFHTYCHAIVHWNLPANPVDLEQREGRVHRFIGHAVRRNVAARHGVAGRTVDGDPWQEMFGQAEGDRKTGESEIRPWWVYPLDDGSVIERYVPALPLSRDRARAEQLRKAVGVYRMAFGQPHQDELLAYLGSEIAPELLARLADDLRIDLTPPGFPPTIGG